MKNASDIFKELPDGSEFAKGAGQDVASIDWLGVFNAMKNSLGILSGTPDVDLEWNEEMQEKAKTGIVSAMATLLDGMKLISGDSHMGDPCVKCGVPHDDVESGKCKTNG